MNPRSESGQATVLVVGLALVCFAVSGLVVDGTRAWLLRRSLQNAADGSALAAASSLDRGAFYGSGGMSARLDAPAAERAAFAYLRQRGPFPKVAVLVGEREVTVSLGTSMPTTWLRLVGIGSIPVGATAAARPFPGEP